MTNLNFMVGFSISGRVPTYRGTGIANTLVQLDRGAFTSTDGNGRYVFANVSPGNHFIAAVGRQGEVGVVYSPWQAVVKVENHNADNVNFYAGFTIRGYVTNGGLPVPNVLVQRRAGESTVGVYTDSSGAYEFFNVRSGTYTVAPGYTPATEGFSFTPGSRTATVDRSHVDLQDFVARFSVSGRITTSAGNALANVTVNLSGGGTNMTATTDAAGNYRFTNVPAGFYFIKPTLANTSFSPQARFPVQVRTNSVTNQNFIAS
jgi:hypothetical protein